MGGIGESFGNALVFLLRFSSHGLWSLMFAAETPCGSDWERGWTKVSGERETQTDVGPGTGKLVGLMCL